jgi:hypothetical protein
MAKTSTGKKVLIIFSVLLVIGLAGTTVYLFMENRDLKSELALSDSERNSKENARIIKEVSELIKLPDEEPVVILVNDPVIAVEDNPGIAKIFDDLQKGDYILVFRNERTAVQYRPSEKKIIKNASISLPIATEIIGSEVAIKSAEVKLAEFGNQLTITNKIDDSVKSAFVYAVNGKLSAEASAIAEQLGIEVGSTLPASITPSDQTEIVIVVTSATTAVPNTTQEP